MYPLYMHFIALSIVKKSNPEHMYISNSESSRILLPRLACSLKGTVTQQTNTLRRTLSGRNPGNVVPAALHGPYRLVVEAVLETNLIWDELVVHARLGEGVIGPHISVDHVHHALHCCCRDAAAACSACHKV